MFNLSGLFIEQQDPVTLITLQAILGI